MSLLTPRQNEVVRYLVKRYTAKEIAGYLGISYRTVQKHMENIYLRTNSHSRFELIYKIKHQHVY